MAKTKKAPTRKASPRKPAATKAAPKRAVARQLKQPHYRSFRLQRRVKAAGADLASSFHLLSRAFRPLWQSWRLFLGIVLVYGLLNLILVRGLSGGVNISSAKSTLD